MGNGLPHTVVQQPARLLTGITLASGWRLVKQVESDKDRHTPGFFSVGYHAERGAERAFLKAFDIGAVMLMNGGGGDPAKMMLSLQQLTSAFNAEDALLKFCAQSKLDRIVRAIETGFAAPPPGVGPAATPFPVPYLLFELAEGDIRKFVGKASDAEDSWRFKHLHEVATGLHQLHTHRIAHQDLKPANILVFADEGAKIGDLGRASRDGHVAPHDNLPIPGDRRYAPPELRYGEMPTSWVDRREASDLYHLGSLMCFLFTGLSVNAILDQKTPEPFRPENWRGRYSEILPHVIAAFTKLLDEVSPQFPEWARDEMTTLLKQMCHPEYQQRGAPDARAQTKNPIGIDRFVSNFDRLSKRATLRLKKI